VVYWAILWFSEAVDHRDIRRLIGSWKPLSEKGVA
jgi:hypothetical protein